MTLVGGKGMVLLFDIAFRVILIVMGVGVVVVVIRLVCWW